MYAATEARSMIAGALAFCLYSLVSSHLMALMSMGFCALLLLAKL